MISFGHKYQSTVLIVEPDPSSAHSLFSLLTSTGYRVILASTGQEAIEQANNHIDLIVLNLMLSDMEGVELCHYFKQSEVSRNIPIVILSAGSCGESERLRSFQLGADDFIYKSINQNELLIHLEVLLIPRREKRVGRLRELKEILDRGLVVPYFQPVYQLEPFNLLGVEVLSRPQTEGAFKNPELLFEAALEFGFYFDLEMMVWQKALNIFKSLGEDQKLFLNCSPHLVENDHFLKVQDMFHRSSVDVSNVFLELTERSAISQHAVFYERLRQYKDFGFKMAIDDVGSGYSSLESIVETRPEVVKIDRNIVHGLLEDSYKRSIVKFVVSFCSEHDIISVAEGVETKEEFKMVKDLGVDACQGYYFYKPAPLLDVPAFRSIEI